MKKFALLLFLGTINLILVAQQSANYGESKFAPADGKKLLIIGQDLGSVGGLSSYSNGYVDNVTTHVPAGVTSYTSIESLSGLTSLANWGAGDVRAQAYLEDETFDHSFIVIGLYLVGILNQINNGQYDSNIRSFANWVKGQDRPVFIRIGYEFEGPWNNYEPTAFKNAWRYIVHIFDEEEVSNAAYVWQSAGLNYNNISSWYPGDEYVNWMGYSQFDGQNMGQSIKSFAVQKDKPIMIAEAAPKVVLSTGNAQSHWDNWFEPLFNEIYQNDRIKAFAYINANWDVQSMWQGQGWGDSRIEANSLIQANWQLEIAKEPWLTADESLLETLNYETWIVSNHSEPISVSEKKMILKYQEEQLLVELEDESLINGLSIFDMNGQLLYKDETESFSYSIPISIFPTQAIVLRVRFRNQLMTTKTILKK